MTFSKGQYDTLAKYESYFQTAVYSGWARNPMLPDLQTMLQILKDATGDRRRLNASCQTCVLHILKDCGRLYFADKEERCKVDALQDDKPEIRTEIKTRKPRTRKKI